MQVRQRVGVAERVDGLRSYTPCITGERRDTHHVSLARGWHTSNHFLVKAVRFEFRDNLATRNGTDEELDVSPDPLLCDIPVAAIVQLGGLVAAVAETLEHSLDSGRDDAGGGVQEDDVERHEVLVHFG